MSLKQITFYIQFDDGSRWVPNTQKIRDNYKANYADATDEELDDPDVLIEWMENNMMWADLGAVMSQKPEPYDYAHEWSEFSCIAGRVIS